MLIICSEEGGILIRLREHRCSSTFNEKRKGSQGMSSPCLTASHQSRDDNDPGSIKVAFINRSKATRFFKPADCVSTICSDVVARWVDICRIRTCVKGLGPLIPNPDSWGFKGNAGT